MSKQRPSARRGGACRSVMSRAGSWLGRGGERGPGDGCGPGPECRLQVGAGASMASGVVPSGVVMASMPSSSFIDRPAARRAR